MRNLLIVARRRSRYDIDIENEESILNIIKSVKIHLNDIWKNFNEINTSIKLSMSLILNNREVVTTYKLSKPKR